MRSTVAVLVLAGVAAAIFFLYRRRALDPLFGLSPDSQAAVTAQPAQTVYASTISPRTPYGAAGMPKVVAAAAETHTPNPSLVTTSDRDPFKPRTADVSTNPIVAAYNAQVAKTGMAIPERRALSQDDAAFTDPNAGFILVTGDPNQSFRDDLYDLATGRRRTPISPRNRLLN